MSTPKARRHKSVSRLTEKRCTRRSAGCFVIGHRGSGAALAIAATPGGGVLRRARASLLRRLLPDMRLRSSDGRDRGAERRHAHEKIDIGTRGEAAERLWAYAIHRGKCDAAQEQRHDLLHFDLGEARARTAAGAHPERNKTS